MFFPDSPRPGTAARAATKNPLFLFWAVVVATSLLALLSTAQAGAALAYRGESVPWNGLLRARLVDWYGYAIFLPALCELVRRRPLDAASWRLALPSYLLLGIPVAIAKEALYVTIGNFFRPGMFSLPDILSEDLSSEVLTAWALIGLAHAIVRRARRSDAPAAPAADEPVAAAQIIVRDGAGYRPVRASDIIWIDAQGNYARITTSRGRYLARETMVRLDERLGPRFLRVHRRIIVNLDRVERIEARSHAEYRLVLEGGESVISARSCNGAIRNLLQRRGQSV